MSDYNQIFRDTRESSLSGLLVKLYGVSRLRRYCLKMAFGWEGGEFRSRTARIILLKYHGVQIGAYSYGSCFIPGSFDRGTAVGRYASIGPGVRVFLRNHPYEQLSLHPYFYNHRLGFVKEDTITFGNLEIGHDAWVGANTIFTPSCSQVGIGAIVGAGSVVTKNVPEFAIVAGNPAKLIRFRFPETTREVIISSRWWEKPIEECAKYMKEMITNLPENQLTHPLLRATAVRD